MARKLEQRQFGLGLPDSLFTNLTETAGAALPRLRVAAVNIPRVAGAAHLLHDLQDSLALVRGVLDP